MLSATNLVANANAASQNVYISDTNSGAVAINAASGAGSAFSVTAPNATSLTTTGTIDLGNTNSGATVSLTAGAGTLAVQAAIGNGTTPVGTTYLSSYNNLRSTD